jgi:hypothetical protein
VVFHISENSHHIERLPIVTVLKHNPHNPTERAIVDQCPSLLGIEVLEKHSVRFTPEKVALEK